MQRETITFLLFSLFTMGKDGIIYVFGGTGETVGGVGRSPLDFLSAWGVF